MTSKTENDIPIANITPFGLRMQPALKRQIEEAAKRNGRSLNSEISARLERSLREHEVGEENQLTPEGLAALSDRVTELESAVLSMINNDRSYDHEMRITSLEANQ